MTEDQKDNIKDTVEAVAAAGAGVGVGGAGGATAGVLALAARGAATAVSAGAIIVAGAAAGGLLAYGVFRLFRKRRATPKPAEQATKKS